MKKMALVLAVAVAAAGCKGTPTEPPEPFQLVITYVVTKVGWNEQLQPRRYECSYTLTARTSGGVEGDAATWLDSEWQFRWANGTNQTYSLDLVDVLDHWGSLEIRSGEVQNARRVAWSANPFDLVYTFRFQEPDGRIRSAPVFVTCM